MRRRIIILGLALIGVLAGISLLVGQAKTATLTVNSKNVSAVSIFKVVGDGEHDEPGSVAELHASGETVKLDKDVSYLLSYKGAEGYADGEEVVKINGDKTVRLNPSYSDEKLNSMLQMETPAIQTVLRQQYPKIGLYSIQPGKLYKWGEWYGTTLVYTGPYTPSRDTLRLVMKKENGTWKVMTDPPYISLSRFAYPNVPVEILDLVNNQETLKPKIL